MSVSLFKSQMGCRMLEKTLRGFCLTEISQQSFRQYRNLSHLVRPLQCLPNVLYESCKNPVNSILRLKFGCPTNRHMSLDNKTKLMEFQIHDGPMFFKTLKVQFLRFTTRKLTEGLSMEHFLENSMEPFIIVTKLISESKFSELEGLLTDECKAEVEKNVALLTPSQRSHIAVKKEDIILSYYLDWDVIQDETKGKKTFLQITVGYHILENYLENMKQQKIELVFKPELFTIYNCRFIRDCTEGVCDQWTINAINLRRLSEYVNVVH